MSLKWYQVPEFHGLSRCRNSTCHHAAVTTTAGAAGKLCLADPHPVIYPPALSPAIPVVFAPLGQPGHAAGEEAKVPLHPSLRAEHQQRRHGEVEGHQSDPRRVSVGGERLDPEGTRGGARGATEGIRGGKVSVRVCKCKALISGTREGGEKRDRGGGGGAEGAEGVVECNTCVVLSTHHSSILQSIFFGCSV